MGLWHMDGGEWELRAQKQIPCPAFMRWPPLGAARASDIGVPAASGVCVHDACLLGSSSQMSPACLPCSAGMCWELQAGL